MESDTGFIDRLQKLISGYSSKAAFARHCGITEGAVNGWLIGQKPNAYAALLVAKACGVQLEWLLTGEGVMKSDFTANADIPDLTPIPRYDIAASAGGGAVIDAENVKDTIAFRSDWLRDSGFDPKQLNVISVMGDSMEPSLYDGDIILVDKREDRPRSGGVYVLNYDGNLLVKRLQPLLNGGFKIISDNPRYDPEIVADSQMERVRVIGRVVWKGGRMA